MKYNYSCLSRMDKMIAVFLILAVTIRVRGVKIGTYKTADTFARSYPYKGPSKIFTKPLSGISAPYTGTSVVYNEAVLNSPKIALNGSHVTYSPTFTGVNEHKCEDGMLVGSINCVTSHCYSMIVGCVAPVNFKINSQDTTTTANFGKTALQNVCPLGFFVIGIKCTLAHCLHLKLICGAAYLESAF